MPDNETLVVPRVETVQTDRFVPWDSSEGSGVYVVAPVLLVPVSE